jgi:Zn-dependent protease with chaperone function
VSGHRSASRLYRLHLALAGLSAALLAGAIVLVVGGLDASLPSPGSIAAACDQWLAEGGPAAVVALAAGGLALASVVLGLRSLRRQVGAGRHYLEGLPIASETTEVDGVACRLIDASEPHAFCAGYMRPAVYVSCGAINQLTEDELRAVVGHEAHHAERRDPLRLLLARALADGLFFIPVLRRSSERYAALGELAADEAAVKRLEGRGPLASALLKFSAPAGQPAPVVGIAPERVDHLLGDPAARLWRLPRSLTAPSAAALIALAALFGAAAHGALEASLNLPILLSAACMLVIPGGPIVVALGAIMISRRTLRARRA